MKLTKNTKIYKKFQSDEKCCGVEPFLVDSRSGCRTATILILFRRLNKSRQKVYYWTCKSLPCLIPQILWKLFFLTFVADPYRDCTDSYLHHFDHGSSNPWLFGVGSCFLLNKKYFTGKNSKRPLKIGMEWWSQYSIR